MKHLVAWFAFSCLCIVGTTPATAQDGALARLQGRVTDQDTGIPITGVHVFIAKSTHGSTTDAEGRYVFSVPTGGHRLVVSHVGFTTRLHDVNVREPKRYELDFELSSDPLVLDSLVVIDHENAAWKPVYARFRDGFLGTTPNAQSVDLLNPEVLLFSMTGSGFRAYASAPIILQNNALGYMVEHHLHAFVTDGNRTMQEGESFFTELTPASPEMGRQWAEAREQAFRGSAPHFFLSLVRARTREEGFVTSIVDDPSRASGRRFSQSNSPNPIRAPFFVVNPARYLRQGASPDEKVFSFRKFMHVVYTEEPESPGYADWQGLNHSGTTRDMQYSWMSMEKDHVTLDAHGYALDPDAMTYSGYMAFERLADLLPKEYRPDTFR